MLALEVASLHVGYGAVEVLHGVDLAVEPGAIVAVLGPSGCGKTTLLRTIAGFEPATAGTIAVRGKVIVGPDAWVPPEQRRIGIVPQDAALFPHLDVAHNISFGLSRTSDRRRVVDEMLRLIGLEGYERRRPAELSGGQQQRVALARALAPSPALVLLDEPFAALDAGLRQQLRAETRVVLRAAQATAVIVTHDQEEALSMADMVAVMLDGRIAQFAPPHVLYDEPATIDVAEFVGDVVSISGTCVDGEVHCALGRLPVRGPRPPDGAVHVVTRPEHLVLDPNGIEVVVSDVSYLGRDSLVRAQLGDAEVSLRVHGAARERVGDRVRVGVNRPVLAYPMRA
ncbi:MAG: ABC transporter ATP-binding protein [Acidimicrobiia bacterium]